MSITTIEDLSDEIFCEIFDYLEGYIIFHAFSNLNNRFQSLLSSPLTRLNLNDNDIDDRAKRIFLDNYSDILCYHQHQIVSIHSSSLENTQLIALTINFDQSFQHLQSLALYSIELESLLPLLYHLSSLPRFIALTVDLSTEIGNQAEIYQLMLNLRKLKYLKYRAADSNDFNITIPLAIPTAPQFTSIEYLNMDHPCCAKDLFTVLSYTPKVRHLKLWNPITKDVDLKAIEAMRLANLRTVSIEIYQMSYDEFEIFIKKLPSRQLNSLSLDIHHDDILYLDAYRWEYFLQENLPQLEKFYFKYYVYFSENYDTPMYLGDQNQFSSAFWLERQWVFKVENDCTDLIYSIQPYRPKWYDYGAKSVDLSKSVKFKVANSSPEYWTKTITIIEYIHHALTVTQIHHLEFSSMVTLEKLNEILILLPDVKTLTLLTLYFSDQSYISEDELRLISLMFHTKRLEKIFLRKMEQMVDLFFLILISSRIGHLQVKCIDYRHAESMVGLILMDIKPKVDNSLRTLSFTLEKFEQNVIEKLTKMIDERTLLDNYIIEKARNEIYIKWK
ncbi:unnamed protein product [Adineta ricciae]|uniref:F-box domain-containing protein n=1 Tax=Adineta ricciae TaxID=249248 RepID=A0A815EW55_ADIRI|nr:unnamed protein product [Adineta ricciae]